MPVELFTNPQDNIERPFDEPLLSYEQSPVDKSLNKGTLMRDGETDVALNLSRTAAEGFLSFEEMMIQKEALKKLPVVEHAPTAPEQMQQIGVNILVMRKDALELAP